MRFILFMCFLLALAKMGYGQEAEAVFGRSFKLYGLSEFQTQEPLIQHTDTGSVLWRSGYSGWRVMQPTVAFQWQAGEGNHHEVELIQLQLSGSTREGDGGATGEADQLEFAISMRYEYQWNLQKDPDRKTGFSLGLGFNPYFFQYQRLPLLSTEFPDRDRIVGMRAFAIPRFNWHISERFYIDINLPICLAEYRYHGIYNEDPAIPLDDRHVHTTVLDALPHYISGRIGIGVKL